MDVEILLMLGAGKAHTDTDLDQARTYIDKVAEAIRQLPVSALDELYEPLRQLSVVAGARLDASR